MGMPLVDATSSWVAPGLTRDPDYLGVLRKRWQRREAAPSGIKAGATEFGVG